MHEGEIYYKIQSQFFAEYISPHAKPEPESSYCQCKSKDDNLKTILQISWENRSMYLYVFTTLTSP